MSDHGSIDRPQMVDSRKWRAVLLLACFYTVSIVAKFVLLLCKVPLTSITSFDETMRWAQGGLGVAVSTYIAAVGLEDYGEKRAGLTDRTSGRTK